MLQMLYQGQYALFFILVFALIFAISFHEFGHALVAKKMGDNTAELQGRLTLNPRSHVDAMGLLAVIIIGFGFGRPVPTNPRNFKHKWADFWVSAAGPGMNLLIAMISINLLALAMNMQWTMLTTVAAQTFFITLAVINIILMVFNLIPIGALDGHYMLPYFLSTKHAYQYRQFNDKYGNMILMGLVALSIFGFPVFRFVWKLGYALLPYITFIH